MRSENCEQYTDQRTTRCRTTCTAVSWIAHMALRPLWTAGLLSCSTNVCDTQIFVPHVSDSKLYITLHVLSLLFPFPYWGNSTVPHKRDWSVIMPSSYYVVAVTLSTFIVKTIYIHVRYFTGIQTLWLKLAKQETTIPRHLVSPLVSRGQWMFTFDPLLFMP